MVKFILCFHMHVPLGVQSPLDAGDAAAKKEKG